MMTYLPNAMRRLIGALSVAVACAGSADTGKALDTPYADLPSKKALAVAGAGERAVTGTAASEPSQSAAAFTALTRCEEARVAAGIEAPCEVVRAGASEVTTGAAIRARAPTTPHPLFLWRFESSSATVFLAGSIHVMKPTLYPLPEQFETAFATSTHLVVEVDTVNAQTDTLREKTLEYALIPRGATIESVLSASAYGKLVAFLTEEEVPLASVERLHPSMLATQLAVARLVALGYLPSNGLESHFITRAGTRAILELETVAEQLAVLTSPPRAVQEEMLVETLDEMHTVEPIVSGMIGAWFAGDDTEFMRLFDASSGASEGYEEFMDRIIDKRNLTMAERISGYLATQGTYFVLVGSAHLAGKAGIPSILLSRGYAGHRIHTDEAIQTRPL